MTRNWFLITIASLSISACGDGRSGESNSIQGGLETGDERWYDATQVQAGAAVFSTHCAVCHGEMAEGLTDDWRQRLPDGNYPAPPLNGSAHAWHHPLSQLSQTIDTGGVPYGGQMPPFKDVLDDEQKLAAIAYFQSFWNDEIYLNWLDMGGLP